MLFGFHHAAFGGEALQVLDSRRGAQGGGEGVVDGDGLFLVVGVDGVVADGKVASEADDFAGDFALEAAEDADGHDHNKHAEGDAGDSNDGQGPRKAPAVFASRHEPLCYEPFEIHIIEVKNEK